MPEDLPTPKKSLKQLEKENNKKLKNNKWKYLITYYLRCRNITRIFLHFYIYITRLRILEFYILSMVYFEYKKMGGAQMNKIYSGTPAAVERERELHFREQKK